jgi:hypothetical protein
MEWNEPESMTTKFLIEKIQKQTLKRQRKARMLLASSWGIHPGVSILSSHFGYSRH